MRKLFMVFLVMALAAFGVITLAGPAAATHTECHDGIDNDGNGLIDFPQDPGCSSIDDFHEEGFVPQPRGQFSCRASAIRVSGLILIGTIEPFVANAPVIPCKAENDSLLSPVTVGPVSAAAVEAVTAVIPGFGAGSFARVVGANVGVGPGIFAEVLRANASVTCSGGSPVLGSESQVTRLIIGSAVVAVPPGHFHITIPGVGTLHLNETITGPNSVVRRALWLATPSALLPDVVIAEAHADYTGNPCGAP
jgi:hypothetical protein